MRIWNAVTTRQVPKSEIWRAVNGGACKPVTAFLTNMKTQTHKQKAVGKAELSNPLARLRHHVTGAIERGEATAIVEQKADAPAEERVTKSDRRCRELFGCTEAEYIAANPNSSLARTAAAKKQAATGEGNAPRGTAGQRFKTEQTRKRSEARSDAMVRRHSDIGSGKRNIKIDRNQQPETAAQGGTARKIARRILAERRRATAHVTPGVAQADAQSEASERMSQPQPKTAAHGQNVREATERNPHFGGYVKLQLEGEPQPESRAQHSTQDNWPEGYDLTSFMHGDDPSDTVWANRLRKALIERDNNAALAEDLKQALKRVTAQRDRLLTACKEMNAATLAGGPYDIDKASVRIRATIAAVESEAGK